MPPPCCDCENSKDYATYLSYQQLLQFLMEINDGYTHVRSYFLKKSNIPNVNQAYAMVLQDESQKLGAGRGGDPVSTSVSSASPLTTHMFTTDQYAQLLGMLNNVVDYQC
ncbi:hypothetical protein H5410_013501 [Solanum commersonii]|uniref:Uncharacterized protein n=1 Tax=Solanum commersonii TaxID=4109 RepID=A0A9J6AVK0_SOLCO|nr:hypothetical protein H5410_013501 [Solanum commersonii]